MSNHETTQQAQHVQGIDGLAHRDDPERPGWCASCRRAFPCPLTLTRAQARALLRKFRDAG